MKTPVTVSTSSTAAMSHSPMTSRALISRSTLSPVNTMTTPDDNDEGGIVLDEDLHSGPSVDSFDNEHDYQMSQLKSLKDRGLSYKKRRMEMRSEFEAFLAQSLGQEASKNMSRLMYDPIYEFPRGYDFSGNLNWQMFLESKQYRPDLLDIDEFEVAARWSSLSSSMEVTSSESPQVLEPSSSLSLVEPRNDVSPQALIDTQVMGSAALEKDWSGRIDFAISERSSSQSFDEFGHSGRYYETRRALDAALQDGLEALIKRDQDVATICANLFRDKDGNIVVESHPKFNNSANGTGMIGNFPPISQGKEGVMTKNGEATNHPHL